MRLATVAVLLLVLAGVVHAGTQGFTPGARVAAEFTDTIVQRRWMPQTACTAWNNASGSVCTAWNNTSLYFCDGARDYIYDASPAGWTPNLRDALGYVANFTATGEFKIRNAGNKVLAGSVDSFNSEYCYKGRNITGTEKTNLSNELLSVGLADIVGKVGKYVPVAVGQAWQVVGDAVAKALGLGRNSWWKFGADSVLTTYTTQSNFEGGVATNTNTSELAGSVLDAYRTNFSEYFYVDPGWTATGASTQLSWNATERRQEILSLDRTGVDLRNYTSYDTVEDFNISFSGSQTAGTGGVLTIAFGNNNNPSNAAFRGVWVHWFDGDNSIYFYRKDAGGLAQLGVQFAYTTGDAYHLHIARRGSNTATLTVHNGAHTSTVGTSTGSVVDVGNVYKTLAVGNYADAGGAVWTGWIDSFEDNATRLPGGTWATPVLGSADNNRWLNFTNTSSVYLSAGATAGMGLSWEERTSNTSFAATDATPAWTPLGNGSASGTVTLLPATGNVSSYAQFRTAFWPNGNNTLALDALEVQYTALPFASGSPAANVSFARPGQAPPQYVEFRVPYRDSESGIARLSITNESSGAPFCANLTFATGNGSAYCTARWNSTADGERPALAFNLTDSDGAWNVTNTTRPVTTDNAAPEVAIDAIGNTSNGTFTPAVHRVDNASGLNYTVYRLFNLTNDSRGETPIAPGNVSIGAGNSSITLCVGCHGQLRISVQADDALPAAFRFNSSLANATVWYDPVPTVEDIQVYDPTNSPVTSTSILGSNRVVIRLIENLTYIPQDPILRVTAPGGGQTDYNFSLWTGQRGDSQGDTNSSWQANFTTTTQGEYTLQVRARDTSTADDSTTQEVFTITSSGGSGAGSAGVGGGGGGAAAPPTPTPISANLTAGSPAVACPSQVQLGHAIWPWQTRDSVLTYSCAAREDISRCVATGEGFACSVSEDKRRATVTYTVEAASVEPLRFSWIAEGDVKLFGAGPASTNINVRAAVTNFATYVPFGLGPADRYLAPFTSLSPASLLLGLGLVGMGLLFASTSIGRGTLVVAGFSLMFWGVMRVVQGPAGPEVRGIFLGWFLFGIGTGAVYSFVFLRRVGQKRRVLSAVKRARGG